MTPANLQDISSYNFAREAKDFATQKSLGQNFLVSPQAHLCILDALALESSDNIIEIGSGIGFLTRLIAKQVANVTAVDLDKRCIHYLQRLNLSNVELKHGDFLQFNLCDQSFDNSEKTESCQSVSPMKVVGNIPYQITGLILGHLLGEIGSPAPWLQYIERIVLTVQLEVAKRIVALPGSKDYSQLSLLINYFCQPEIVTELPKENFWPQPEITSAVVRLIPFSSPAVKTVHTKLLRQLIAAGFNARRKMLRNNLAFTRIEQKDIDKIFDDLNFDPQSRAENLSLQHFAKLADAIQAHLENNA